MILILTHQAMNLLKLKAAIKLKECGQFLQFRNYYTVDQIKLVKAHYCNKHLLCPICAGVRAARSMKRYLERIYELMDQKRGLKPVLITLTVKNGEDLEERFEHLTSSFKTLLQRYRDFKKRAVVLINSARLMALSTLLNTPITKKLSNGIRIFISSLYSMNG